MTDTEFDKLEMRVQSLEIARALHGQSIKDNKLAHISLSKDVKSVLKYQQGLMAIIGFVIVITGLLLQAGIIDFGRGHTP